MTGKTKPTERDAALFRKKIGAVTPIHHDRIEPERKTPRPHALFTRRDEEQVIHDLLSDDYDPAELDTGEHLFYCRSGLQHRLLRKLRRGQFSVSAELDLHGMIVPAARQSLVLFLKECRATGQRCVRIIHGKGLGSRNKGPILKNKVNSWLRQREEVLAFCSARPIDGGTGAVYVLLKQK